MPELVPSIGERDRRRPIGDAVPGQDLDALGAGQLLRIEPKTRGEAGIQTHQMRRDHRRRIETSGALATARSRRTNFAVPVMYFYPGTPMHLFSGVDNQRAL